MKRIVFLVLTSAVLVPAIASQFDVLDPKGAKKGTGNYYQTVTKDRITMRFVMAVSEARGTMKIEISDVYTTVGNPVSKTYRFSLAAQTETIAGTTGVTFSGRKATVTSTAMGQKKVSTLTAPGSVTDPSVVWATGKVPAVGKKVVYYSFDPFAQKFTRESATYHGIRTVQTRSKKVSAHVITATHGEDTQKLYFTSKGDMVKLESKQFTLIQK